MYVLVFYDVITFFRERMYIVWLVVRAFCTIVHRQFF
jgi:hypothetical protein